MDYDSYYKRLNAGLVSSPDDNWWTGVLWCFYSDGTHSLPLLRHISTNTLILISDDPEGERVFRWFTPVFQSSSDRSVTLIKKTRRSDVFTQTNLFHLQKTCRQNRVDLSCISSKPALIFISGIITTNTAFIWRLIESESDHTKNTTGELYRNISIEDRLESGAFWLDDILFTTQLKQYNLIKNNESLPFMGELHWQERCQTFLKTHDLKRHVTGGQQQDTNPERHIYTSLFCSAQLLLLDQKYCTNLKYYYNLNQLFSVWICVKL